MMRILFFLLLLGALVFGSSAKADAQASPGDTLREPSDFASIGDDAERSVALFTEAAMVLVHPRCINCHPAGDNPLQGEDGHLHEPPVRRGKGGMGVAGMRCNTCHQRENFDPGGVPGAALWVLAPRKMGWEGLSLGEICEQIKDPERNGGRTLEEIVEHVSEDDLVGWGWTPGRGREPAPGTQEAFGELMAAWAEAGAVCP
jgi:hypothetical protein